MQVVLGKLGRMFGWGWLEHQSKTAPVPHPNGAKNILVQSVTHVVTVNDLWRTTRIVWELHMK